jgi:uncharacterized protein YcgL (UPF0745 family)
MPDLSANCHVVACPHCLPYHPAIIQQLYALKDSDQARKSHYFAGRYENIYLAPQVVPEIDVILDSAVKQAASLLACKPSDLQLRFWFNLMQQNDVTLPHTHDVNDEVLSATYYLQIPPQSGKLLLRLADSVREIVPSEGTFVFFDPEIEHEVTIHQHAKARISLGLNFGYSQPD